MPGAVLRCEKCGQLTRWGYSTFAVEYAAQTRGVSTAEIIEDYYQYNRSLKTEPDACPGCKAPKTALKEIEKLS